MKNLNLEILKNLNVNQLYNMIKNIEKSNYDYDLKDELVEWILINLVECVKSERYTKGKLSNLIGLERTPNKTHINTLIYDTLQRAYKYNEIEEELIKLIRVVNNEDKNYNSRINFMVEFFTKNNINIKDLI